MPRTSPIFFNAEEFKKLKEKAEKEGYPSIYAYVKDLIIEELRKPLI